MAIGEWLVEYLVAKDRGTDGNPPRDAAAVTIHVTAGDEYEARKEARTQILRQYPDEVKWERDAHTVPSSADNEWASGVSSPGGEPPAWPLAWQRGTDKYNSWCVDCQGEAKVYDGHIIGYDHKDSCPNR